jgi:NUMOD4 motif/HNH endonuclease
VGNRTCSIDGCSKPVKARGWCGAHDQSCRRYGSPYGKPAVALVPLPGERWVPVVRWEGRYAVSDCGRVRNVRTGQFIGWTTGNGYRLVTLCDDGGTKEQPYIHFLVAEAFIGPRPTGQEVRHLDGSRDSNARVNLAYGTISRNSLDSIEHGTHYQASKTHCAKGNHEFTPANTYLHPKGSRVCRICSNEARQRYKQRMKAA